MALLQVQELLENRLREAEAMVSDEKMHVQRLAEEHKQEIASLSGKAQSIFHFVTVC